MAETGTLPHGLQEQLGPPSSVDAVVGLPSLQSVEELSWLSQTPDFVKRIVIAVPNHVTNSEQTIVSNAPVVPFAVSAGDRLLNPTSLLDGSFLEIFQISQRLEAKCCLVWNGNPAQLSTTLLDALLSPALDQNCDLTLPRYSDVKLGSLINNSILYPAVSALYGKRIRYPMATDCVFSAQLVNRLLQVDPKTKRLRAQQWVTSEAICGGRSICQVNLPIEPPRPPESADASSILAMVLGRLFQDLERNVSYWQKSNGPQVVPTFGDLAQQQENDGSIDVQSILDKFQLGYRNLKEIWNVALPPATFLELKKLTTLKAEAFRLPDDLWVHVVYDFALTYRQRSINREHLLRAMTPLYLAWVVSHVLEIQNASSAALESRLERLALCYEKYKPYLVSRWRWPDRFNP